MEFDIVRFIAGLKKNFCGFERGDFAHELHIQKLAPSTRSLEDNLGKEFILWWDVDVHSSSNRILDLRGNDFPGYILSYLIALHFSTSSRPAETLDSP